MTDNPAPPMDECRKAFEADCAKNDVCNIRHRKCPDQYQLYETQLRWMGFQSAWQTRTPPAQELTVDEREKIIGKIQNEYADKQGKYRDMSIRTVVEAYEGALKAAGCKIVKA